MTEKIPKPAALYMPPALIERGLKAGETGARCGGCMMFIKDIAQCTILEPAAVNGKTGVCGLFVGGKSGTSADHKAMKIVPASVAGYITNGPTQCGNCTHFDGPAINALAMCYKVAGLVNKDGCCNSWKSNKDKVARIQRLRS